VNFWSLWIPLSWYEFVATLDFGGKGYVTRTDITKFWGKCVDVSCCCDFDSYKHIYGLELSYSLFELDIKSIGEISR